MQTRDEREVAQTAVDLDDDNVISDAYHAHGPELYRFVLRNLGDPGAAQDVVQESFLRAWRAADRFDPQLASLRVWLFAIARNVMIDQVRAARVRPWQGDVVDLPATHRDGPVTEDPSEQIVRSWVVEEALRRLSEEHRTAIVETHLKGRPHIEVAAELGIPVGTLRSRLFYGLKALKIAMDEMGIEP